MKTPKLKRTVAFGEGRVIDKNGRMVKRSIKDIQVGDLGTSEWVRDEPEVPWLMAEIALGKK